MRRIYAPNMIQSKKCVERAKSMNYTYSTNLGRDVAPMKAGHIWY